METVILFVLSIKVKSAIRSVGEPLSFAFSLCQTPESALGDSV